MGKFIDETGNRYGRLKVIERAKEKSGGAVKWLCDCDCGNQTIVSGSRLRSGQTKSCGCYRKDVCKSRMIDETGNRHGRLVVTEYDHSNKKWKCKCDCGNTTSVRGYSLRSGMTKSCGCLQKERTSAANYIDISGERFERLTAIKMIGQNDRGANVWLCECDCGNQTEVPTANLRNGNTRSCGCLQKDSARECGKIMRKDISGEKFGMLTALEPTPERANGAVVWRCKCDCGNEHYIAINQLSCTKSCGCLGGKIVEEEPGNRYGKLTVIKYFQGETDKIGPWLCRCDCGNEVVVSGTCLRKGNVKSCGCLYSEVAKEKWASGVYDGAFQSPTTPEIKTAKALDKLDIEYEREYRPDGYRKVYDFLVRDDILIEVQGDYWHANPDVYNDCELNDIQRKNVQSDLEKSQWAKENGYSLVELWEKDINETGSVALIEDVVLPLLGGIGE